MNMLLEERQEEIQNLCLRHAVARLKVFGSAVEGAFESGRSDVDFLVQFASCTPEDHARRYFGLLADLRDLFRCDVDLVEIDAVENPYFLRRIEASRTVLYAA